MYWVILGYRPPSVVEKLNRDAPLRKTVGAILSSLETCRGSASDHIHFVALTLQNGGYSRPVLRNPEDQQTVKQYVLGLLKENDIIKYSGKVFIPMIGPDFVVNNLIAQISGEDYVDDISRFETIELAKERLTYSIEFDLIYSDARKEVF